MPAAVGGGGGRTARMVMQRGTGMMRWNHAAAGSALVILSLWLGLSPSARAHFQMLSPSLISFTRIFSALFDKIDNSRFFDKIFYQKIKNLIQKYIN